MIGILQEYEIKSLHRYQLDLVSGQSITIKKRLSIIANNSENHWSLYLTISYLLTICSLRLDSQAHTLQYLPDAH
jgi:hypothetical protein